MSFLGKIFRELGKAVTGAVSSILGIKSKSAPPPPVSVELPNPPPPPAQADIKQQSEAMPASYSDSSGRLLARKKTRKSLLIRGIGIPGTE